MEKNLEEVKVKVEVKDVWCTVFTIHTRDVQKIL